MHFLRGRPELCQHIKRVKIKGNGGRKPSNPETEPKFYLYPPIPPPLSPQGEDSGSRSQLPASTASGAPAKVARAEGSFMPPQPNSLGSSNAAVDLQLAQFMALGVRPQNGSSATSYLSPVDELKRQAQELSLMSFMSNVKNGRQTQLGTHPVLALSPFETHQPLISLSGAPYSLSSTMGASAPHHTTASFLEASASNMLQLSLLQDYSRRVWMEAQARERDQLLSFLLRPTPPLTSPIPVAQGLVPSFPVVSVVPPANVPLLPTSASSVLLHPHQQPEQTKRSKERESDDRQSQ
jgi:hypothetical protein